MQYLTIWDLILTPVYLIILSELAKRYRDKHYPTGHPLRPYYLKGLYVKFAGAVFIALVFQYYYGGGDTFNYFTHAQQINATMSDSFGVWLKVLTRSSVEANPEIYPYASQIYWYNDPSSYAVCSIAAVFGLLNGTSYLPIALLFAYFSYTGIWAMYRTFTNIYPQFYKELAIAFLFIPSTFVWGSAIFKDTVCMFGLGWLTYTTFRIFINKDFSIKNIFLLALSFYIIAMIKLYILLAFIPALSLWLLMTYAKQIKSPGVRWLVNMLFIGMSIGGFMVLSQRFAEEMGSYSLEKVAKTAATTRDWIGYVSDVQEGSGYDLGEFDPSIVGMLSKFPQAVVVTFFRPFPWEARKVIVALSALEALAFLYLTTRVILTRRKALKKLLKDPNIIFFLIFSVIFAFAVGISSYNFGALSRYKIPCLPFYAAMIVILLRKDQPLTVSQQRKMVDFKRIQPAM